MDEHDDDGFELLAAALAAAEADGAALPAANLRAALEGARAIGLSFDVAWGRAINRLQVSGLRICPRIVATRSCRQAMRGEVGGTSAHRWTDTPYREIPGLLRGRGRRPDGWT